MKEASSGRPLTRIQAAEITGLSVRTIDRMIADGTLPASKHKRAIRIDYDGFQRYLAGSRVLAKTSTSLGNDRQTGSVHS